MRRCRYCDAELPPQPPGRGQPRKYCDSTCRERARQRDQKAEVLAAMGPRLCRVCNDPIPDAAPLRQRCCSPTCNGVWQNRKHRAAERADMLARREPCHQCGGPIPDDRKSSSVYCSYRCKKLANNETWRRSSAAYMRRYLYKVTPEQYDAMWAAQGGRCAICRTDDWPGKGNRPHTDHDHGTKRFRGILCGNCNNGLGNFGDDPARLRAAAGYLERARAAQS